MNLSHATISTPYLHILPYEESHIAELTKTGASPEIWSNWPKAIDGSEKSLRAYFDDLLELNANGEWLVHSIFTPSGEAIGQSCYMNIRPNHFGVEIGATWYGTKFQAGFVNPLAKLMLLNHAFPNGAKRVELKTDILNLRSRAAIAKLGAKYEGIFRKHMKRPDGTMRDTVYFAIIDDDWIEVKTGLIKRLDDLGITNIGF